MRGHSAHEHPEHLSRPYAMEKTRAELNIPYLQQDTFTTARRVPAEELEEKHLLLSWERFN